MQTKFKSLVESVFDVTVGYIVALMVQLIVFPLYEIETSMIDNLSIALNIDHGLKAKEIAPKFNISVNYCYQILREHKQKGKV